MLVLIVEDAAAVRLRLAGMLRDLPGVERVLESEGVPQAMAALAQHTPDVIVLDLHLGSETGFGLLSYVKRRLPGVQVLVLTNDASEPTRRSCARLGADHFFDKSTEFEAALELLERQAAPAGSAP